MKPHAHHYVFPPNGNGATSVGVCKFCKAKTISSNVYDRDRPENVSMRQALPGTRGDGTVKRKPPQIGKRPEQGWVAPLPGKGMTR